MNYSNNVTRQGGKATSLALVLKLVVICTVGAVVALLATSAAKNSDQLAKLPMSSAHAEGPDSTSRALPSSAQAKTWDHVEYGPDDWAARPGQIEY